MARIVGKRGSVYIGGVKQGDVFNWEFEFEVETAECGIKGEKHENYAVGVSTSRVRAQRYVQDTVSSLLFLTGAVAAGTSGGNSTSGTTVTFTLDGIDGGATGPVISGEGFVSRGSLRVPRGMIQDEFEITCTVMPTVT